MEILKIGVFLNLYNKINILKGKKMYTLSWGDDDDNDDYIPIIESWKPRIITIYPKLQPHHSVISKTSTDIILKNAWNFYIQYRFNKKAKLDYSAYNVIVGYIRTVNIFWDFFEEFPFPSEIFSILSPNRGIEFSFHNRKRVEAFSIFKEGISPTWEDPINHKGGHYEFSGEFTLDELDFLWKTTVLLLIGEAFYDCGVTGIRVLDKTVDYRCIIQYRFEIWMENRDDALIENFNYQHIHNSTIKWDWKSHS